MVTCPEEISPAPRIVRAEEGALFCGGPEMVRTILSSAQTGGAFLLTETTVRAPHYGPPYHVHTREDETFIVLEGTLVLTVDGVRHELKAGDTAYGPRDVPHTWTTGPEGARFYIMVSGDNFERFYPRFCAAAAAGDMHLIPGIAAEHGISFIPQE